MNQASLFSKWIPMNFDKSMLWKSKLVFGNNIYFLIFYVKESFGVVIFDFKFIFLVKKFFWQKI